MISAVPLDYYNDRISGPVKCSSVMNVKYNCSEVLRNELTMAKPDVQCQ